MHGTSRTITEPRVGCCGRCERSVCSAAAGRDAPSVCGGGGVEVEVEEISLCTYKRNETMDSVFQSY